MRTPARLVASGALAALAALVVNPGLADSLHDRVAPAVSAAQSELVREGLYHPSVASAPVPATAAKTPTHSAPAKGTSAATPVAAQAIRAAKGARAAKPTSRAAGTTNTAPRATSTAKRVASPAPAGKATSYAFETVNSRGEPARWNTCATIPVVVDTLGAPAGVIADLRTALARVNAATGLRFAITGTANRSLTAHDSDNPTTPVLVGFANGLSGVFGDAGVAGLTSTGVMPGTNVISGATVAFNTDLLGTFGAGYTGADPRVPMFMHEFAHMAGLDHVKDTTQLMYVFTATARQFGAGDLAGLRRLATPGCAPVR